MKISEYIKNVTKNIKIMSSLSYHYIKYKLKLETYNNTVINVCNSLIHHSYIFIKIIQWGIQNVYDLNFDEELSHYFNSFSNNVPYTPFEVEQSILSIHNAVDYAFTTWNDKLEIDNNSIPIKSNFIDLKMENIYIPINSGSVALIYKGRLNSKPVIIKVLRCNIKKIIEEDICFFEYFFDNVLVKMIVNRYIKINFKKLITNNRNILLKQCDFDYEANNALLFKDKLKNKKNIIVPQVYKHFTDAFHDIIIMDYLDGSVAKNVPLYQLQNHFETIRTLCFEFLFKYNILHGDFHLGNIIIIDETRIGIIDFGIAYILNNEISSKIFDILMSNLNKKKNKYPLLRAKIFIKMICRDETKCEEIFKKIKSDHELVNLFYNSKFSGNALVVTFNKILSMDHIELDIEMSNLILSAMSSLQTLNNSISSIDNDNKSLTTFINSYIENFKI